MKKIRVFISSPSDVMEERELLSTVVIPDVRKIFGDIGHLFGEEIDVQAISWEKDAYPSAGEDTQAILNEQLGEYDILIGIMWKRFGTPTPRAPSGTIEEFDIAIESYQKTGYPQIMFYFKTKKFYTDNPEEIAQFNHVIQFKKKSSREIDVFYWQYDGILEFERNVRIHLIKQILTLITKDGKLAVDELDAIKEGSQKRKTKIKVKIDKLISGQINIAKQIKKSEKIEVFISYANEDEQHAIRLYSELKNAGISAWIDKEKLLPGQNWGREITKVIEESRYFIIVLSHSSVSKMGFVQKEIKTALDILQKMPESEIYILPVRIDDCTPLHEELKNIHWVDLFPSWENGLNLLIKTIKVG